jgi:hypothetical protein
MKKHIISVTAATFLGIIVMLMPIITYSFLLGNNEANTLGVESNEQRESYDSASWNTLEKTAQILGKKDSGLMSFQVNLSQALLLVTMSLVVTLATSIVIKKMLFAV